MAARCLLGQILKDHGVIHEGMVQEALAIQRDKGGRIGELLIGLDCISAADLAKALASQAGMEYLDLSTTSPDPEAIKKLDGVTARTVSGSFSLTYVANSS